MFDYLLLFSILLHCSAQDERTRSYA